jgi:cell division protein FtsQ
MGGRMWDNHKLLNTISNGLFAFAFALLAWGAVKLLVESPVFLLRAIRVESAQGSNLAHVGRAQVIQALEGRLAGTFFNMDLDAVRVLFETIPWVRRAEVRRVWPDSLVVRMEEHVPMARWGQPGENRMVNTQGEVFSAAYGSEVAALPLLSGPAGTARELTRRYAAFAQAVAPLALRPEAVMLSPRYSWQLKLSNGLVVQLGRDPIDKSGDKSGNPNPNPNPMDNSVDARLARLVSVYSRTLTPLGRRLDYVDLRYSNGFALRVAGLRDLSATPLPTTQKRPPQQARKTPA